jgi:uncharacterized protein YhhL (DUF1145 family)
VTKLDRTDRIKIVLLVFYLLLAWVAITQPLTLGATISQGLLVLLVALHLLECWVYRDLIREAPGSPGWHLFNVFMFGVIHMLVMKSAIRGEEVW